MKRLLAAAFLLGAATALAFAPFQLFPLPLLTLGGLYFLLGRTPLPRQGFALGFAWGLGCFLTGVSWVYVSMHDVGGMAAPLAALAALLFAAYLALFPGLAAWAWVRWRPPGMMAGAWLAAALWCLGEWLRGTLLTGFPWLALGYAQAPPSPLAGYAPLLGVYGLSFITVLLAAALAGGGRRWQAWLFVAVVAFGGAGLQVLRWTEPAGRPISVALLQGNIPQTLKWAPENLDLSVDTYLRLGRSEKADLVVLPETAIPLMLHQVPADYWRSMAQGSAIIAGSVVGQAGGGYINGAVVLDAQGQQAGIYGKRHLVPFGEFIPPGFSWFFRLVQIPLTDFSAGDRAQAPLAVAGQNLAPTICYEDLFGEELVPLATRSTLLLNLSNTAWFGRSLAQPQHLQIAQLRALETGRPMLRSTNTGMTAVIDAGGQVQAVLPPFETGNLRVEVQGRQGLTPYLAGGGNGPVLMLCLVTIVMLMVRRRKTRSR